MKMYPQFIKNAIFGCLVGLFLVIWGYAADGIVRIILGGMILFISITNYFDSLQLYKERKRWWSKNEGKLIFFYPTNKKTQNKIELEITPIMPNDVFKVYYDGPNLGGDIPKFILKEIMSKFIEIKVNEPSVFKIVDNKINFNSLAELKNIDDYHLIKSEIKRKIDEIYNTYTIEDN